MVKKFYIALKLLGINNGTLVDIIKLIPEKQVKNLLSGEYFNLQYKYNIDLSKYHDVLNNNKLITEKIKEAEEIIRVSKELEIKVVIINSRFYPNNLKSVDNPPAILYLKGKNFTKKDEKAIACVGTRQPTEFGTRAVSSIVESLVKENFIIVSGLAMGIDAESHCTCLKSQGRTVAVLAHGLDTIYPKENKGLMEDILKSGGTLISEYPVKTRPDKFRFVERNRIISGLSKGVVVFEAKSKSGTMHTVNFAIEQKRKVFCPIPVRKDIQSSGLTDLLFEKKAIGIKSKDDYDTILKELGFTVMNDVKKIMQAKNKSINEIYSSCNITMDTLDDIIKLSYDKKSGITVNREIYDIFKQILSDNNLSVKEFFNTIIVNVVSGHKDKGGSSDE
ncbi:MAG: DNA-processing protein DprA [Bacillota bacterium]|nr:DNA-processing protein DprA [Bacillota bacterium]